MKRYTDKDRTFDPKYHSYYGDGTGRDTYVVTNNGGLTHENKPYMMRRPHKPVMTKRNHTPSRDAVPVIYHADGSGRDSYCVSNSGGLISDYGHSTPTDSLFR